MMMATSANLNDKNGARSSKIETDPKLHHKQAERRQEKRQVRGKRGANFSSSLLIDARSSSLLRNSNNNMGDHNNDGELQNRISPAEYREQQQQREQQFATRLASLTSQRQQQQQVTSGLIRAPQRELQHLVATSQTNDGRTMQQSGHPSHHPVLKHQANQHRHATLATSHHSTALTWSSSSSCADQMRERVGVSGKSIMMQQEHHLLRESPNKVMSGDVLQHQQRRQAGSPNSTMAIININNNNSNHEMMNNISRFDGHDTKRTKPMLATSMATTATETAINPLDKATPKNNNIIFPLTNSHDANNLIPPPPAQFTPLQNNVSNGNCNLFSHHQANNSHQYNNDNINSNSYSYSNGVGFRAATPSASATRQPNPPPYVAIATGSAHNNSTPVAHVPLTSNGTRSLQRSRQNNVSGATSNLQHRISLAQQAGVVANFRNHHMTIGAQFSPNAMLLNAPNSNATMHNQQQVPIVRNSNNNNNNLHQLQNNPTSNNINSSSNNSNNIDSDSQQQHQLHNVITSSPITEFSRNLHQVRSNNISNANNMVLRDQQSKQVNNCADISIKWYTVVVALLGLICALVGTILGVVHSTAGRDYLSLSLLLIGVGLVLVAITWIALRVCINAYKKSHSSFNSQASPSHPIGIGLPSLIGNSTMQLDHRLASLVHPPPHQLAGCGLASTANTQSNRPHLLNDRLYLMAVASAAVAAAASQQVRLQQPQQEPECESNTNNNISTNIWSSWLSRSGSDNPDGRRQVNRRFELLSRFTQFWSDICTKLSARRNLPGSSNLEPSPAFCEPIQVTRQSMDQPPPIPANQVALAAFLSHYQAAIFHQQQLVSGPRALFGPDSRPPPPSYNASITQDRWRTFQQQHQQQHHVATLRMQSSRALTPASADPPSQPQQQAPVAQIQTSNITQQQQNPVNDSHDSSVDSSRGVRRDDNQIAGLNRDTANGLNSKHTI